MDEPTRVHLVLSSGGMRCFSYVGAVRALEERGVEFASVSACSAGSFTGALIGFAAMGLANRAVPLDELDATVRDLCDEILANSTGTLAAYKDLYRATEDLSLDQGLAYEADARYDIADTQERLKDFLAR